MIERVCIVGAGTIGSLFAGHLAQVVDVSVLTRRRERIVGRSDLHARVFATAAPDELADFDLGIISCKGTDLAAVAAALEGRFPEATSRRAR